MNRSPLRVFLLIPFVLGCFALSPQARAVCQDACLTNNNTVQGDDALISLTTGNDNTAIGFNALSSNTAGFSNTATGFQALLSNTTGFYNTAIGSYALWMNTTGIYNTAIGDGALLSNTTGNDNTATGATALYFNTTGNGNIALGDSAGTNLTTGDNNIDIGNSGVAGESNTIRIGTQGTQNRTFIAGISGSVVGGGSVPVRVTTSGRLGTAASSERFKENIQPMDKASEAILALKPVTFRYKKEIDPDRTPEFGLVAEDVEKVNPALVARDDQGRPYSVRYEAVNAMLLNEFLKAHRKVEEQEAMITELKSMVAQQQKESRSTAAQQQNEIKALAATVKEQAAQIQKVSAEVEASRRAQQTVVSNP